MTKYSCGSLHKKIDKKTKKLVIFASVIIIVLSRLKEVLFMKKIVLVNPNNVRIPCLNQSHSKDFKLEKIN